jgi:O-succinylbenzoate synthase
MRVWVSPYTLKSAASLNSRSAASERRGVLLKAEFKKGFGYSCLQPWPELGDEPLTEQIQLLRKGVQTEMMRRALTSAGMDSEFRAQGVSAFEELSVPESHSLVTDLSVLNSASLRARFELGFRALKLKLGKDLEREAHLLSELGEDLAAFRLRFDFNSSLQLESCLQWMDSLSSRVRDAVEFLEDPIPWNAHEWSVLSLRSGAGLAVDIWDERTISSAEDMTTLPVAWIIVKPAVQDPERLLKLARRKSPRVCFTSYLDHPLGQTIAAFEAGRANKADAITVGTCGLLSHTVYEPNSYSRLLSTGSRWISSDDKGFGFTRLLEEEKWKRL